MTPLPRTVGVAALAGLLASCSASNDARTGSETRPLASAAASDTPLAEAGPAPPPAPVGAPPLSERRSQVLMADLVKRMNDAFERHYPGPPSEVVADTFLVISGEPSAPLDAAAKTTRDTVNALWRSPFLHRPDMAVVVWVTSSQIAMHALVERHAYGVRDTGIGLYDPHTRQIFVALGPSGWGGLQHELIHPLIGADMPLAPAWLAEGLAALFEVSQVRGDGSLAFGAHFRLQTLRTTLSNPATAREAKLDALFTWTTDASFHSHEPLHYAVAREALRWLHSQGLLWPFYAAWRDAILEDPTGEKSFEAVVHETPAEATEAWRSWARSAEAEDAVPAASAPEAAPGRGQ